VKIEAILKEKGLELPEIPKPIANYVPAVRTGNLVFLSGHGPQKHIPAGKVGKELTFEEGYEAARNTALCLISTLKNTLGDLNKVKRIVKLVGFVNCSKDFKDQPKVVNGASDLFVEIFGEKGKHARSAVGMYQLPGGIPVEIELIVEVED
jgi:enamine deaminase RidA (YjgF/YER057c/UK114 family)